MLFRSGQDAVNTAKAFNEKIDFDGVVLTKLDGDTRGGAALTIKHVVNKPIKFVGLGEKMADLDVFHPDRMASRILGMGELQCCTVGVFSARHRHNKFVNTEATAHFMPKNLAIK